MKLYIMTDLEGVAGVLNSADWLGPTSRYYEKAKRLLTEEVNAAIRGLIEGGFKEIVVADGHGHGGIDVELLDTRAMLMRGWPKKPYPFGLDKSYSAVAFIGQHAKAGTEFSHLTHTGWWNCLDFTINGVSVGEYGQIALVAGELGVPVIFASGEKALCGEAQSLTPWVITAAVKEGKIGGTGSDLSGEDYEHFHEGAVHLSPVKSRELIFSNAKDAAEIFQKDRSKFEPLYFPPPYKLEQKLRPYQGKPALNIVHEHKTSVINLLNKNY